MRLLLSLGLAAILALPADAQDKPRDLATVLDALDAAPCEDSGLTCLTLAVPRDHAANDPDDTINITFAISLASEPSKGIVFYTVGGPGGSGVQVAESYVGYLDEAVQASIDFVFFDQRGVGPENGVDCPLTLAGLFAAELPLDRPDETLATTRAMVTACLAEAGQDALIPVLGTDQAIRDVEAFRQAIGAPKVWLYGESYGTQFSQAYATAFPDAVRGVIIDGVIDLNLSHHGFNASYVAAAERILSRVFAACETIPACAADMQGDAGAVYDGIAAQLAPGSLMLDYPTGDGSTQSRPLTSGMLSLVAFNALYGPDGRSELLRVLAAASRGNRLPLLRAAYSALGVDPVTLEGQADPGWFGAAYYGVTCADYGEAIADPDSRARAMIVQAQDFAAQAPRLLRNYYEERLICSYWPVQGLVKRPAPFAGGDYPTLILNADADPITPITQSYSVLDHVRNGFMVTMAGGPHVLYGRGLACPDQIVTDLLLEGTLPEAQMQLCEQEFIGRYEPLTLSDPATAQPLDLARAVVAEIAWMPEVYNWGGDDPLAVGCDFGGTLSASSGDNGTAYVFDDCAFWSGLTVSGAAIQADDDMPGEGLTLDLTVAGLQDGRLHYRDNSNTDTRTIEGTWNGVPVTTPRLMP